MAKPLPQPFDKRKVVAENRRARFDYFVEERLEAGIQLTGTEVKSLRQGEGSIAESYATVEGEEVWLINSHIPEYSHGNRLNHQPRRQRKLLLKGREIAKLHGAVTRAGADARPAFPLFQRQRPGESRARAGPRQEDARQARDDEGAGLEARAAAAAEAQWLSRTERAGWTGFAVTSRPARISIAIACCARSRRI